MFRITEPYLVELENLVRLTYKNPANRYELG